MGAETPGQSGWHLLVGDCTNEDTYNDVPRGIGETGHLTL